MKCINSVEFFRERRTEAISKRMSAGEEIETIPHSLIGRKQFKFFFFAQTITGSIMITPSRQKLLLVIFLKENELSILLEL